MYHSFSALAALIRLSHSFPDFSPSFSIYPSFASDGCIFQVGTLAGSLGDSCDVKEYVLALVDLGRAALIALTSQCDADTMREKLLHVTSFKQYAPS